MLDACDGSTMDDDIRELRSATAAFLADRYDDGTYVATADDITELHEATATILSTHADGECFFRSPLGPGLLLPDKQFLLPVTDAVSRVRGAAVFDTDLVNLVDECLDAQFTYGGLTDIQPDTLLQKADFVEDQFALQEVLYDRIDDLLGQRAETNISTDEHSDADGAGTHDRMDKALDEDDRAFDTSNIAYRFHASNAAAFFDPIANAVVQYASFDQLLEIELTPLIPQFTDSVALKVITKLPTILEEEVQRSAASDSSMDFAGHRGVLKSFESRQENSLDDGEELHDYEDLDHNNDLQHEEYLDLTVPVSQPLFPRLEEKSDHKLLGTKVSVLEALRAHSSTDVPMFIADIKQKTHLLMDDLERLALTGRLDEVIDVIAKYMVAVEKPIESAVS
ncbi:hypothetical protein E8E12_008818 [Didymella heteroderae]|uniref:Uncharacterized protein n=1 Tax=Didymella heteroderae TaxID=1769908 RepID=A0A9P4WPB0_9PLEO|nr:hypothetical protein E8E12_008818 [Didymella heteroderae]